MKKFDPVTVIGSLCCIVAMVVILFHNWRKAEAEARYAQQHPTGSAVITSAPADPSIAAPKPVVAPQSVGAAVAAEQIVREPVVMGIPGKFSVTIDAMGGGIQAVQLDEYTVQTRNESKKDAPVVMGEERIPFMSLSAGGQTLLESSEPEIGPTTLSTHRIDNQGTLRYDESWEILDGEGTEYSVLYTLKVTNLASQPMALPSLSLSCGALPDFLSTESNTSFSKYLSGSVAYGRVDKDDAKSLDMKAITKKMTPQKAAEYQVTPANWVSVSSKYFIFALRSPTAGQNQTVFPGFSARQPSELLPREFFSASAYLPGASINPGETQTFTVMGYAGPKSYQKLEHLGHGLPSILNMDLFFFWHFDWMGWICKMLLKGLNFIAGCFPPSFAYGLAIILITLFVKLVFMPLSWHSTRSMKKMSALQPQIKVIREKYKDDAQRMYYEQQKLFKENNVSQTGGCLPMLVQIPVFFAMFNTFRGAIEIRNAGFLWVADLSMPDPIFGLPIHPLAIMTGLTMFLQQRLQPMPDPNQARMMNIMSLVFVVFFYNMPAGLTLYMTVNQLTSIAQMLCFKWLEKRAAKNAPAAAAKHA